MFESAAPLVEEFAELEASMSDPAVHADLARARRIGRRYAELTPIVKSLEEYQRLSDDLAAARELAADDASFVAEASALEAFRGATATDPRAWFAVGWLSARQEASTRASQKALRRIAKAPRFWKRQG